MENSLWYGSNELKTALSEVAYYRFIFLNDSTANLDYIHVLLTAYSISIKTKKGISLEQPPFDQYRALISSPSDYSKSQELSGAMRASNVLAFTYFSARAQRDGVNVAVFSPEVFAQSQPHADMQTWKCIADNRHVEFIRVGVADFHRELFPVDRFQNKGQIPKPVSA